MPTIAITTELTPSEEKNLTAHLTKALDTLESVKKEAAETSAEYRSQIKSLDARVHELKETLKSGAGSVNVEVEERPGPSGIIELFRIVNGTDASTWPKVGERPVTDKDRQGDLFAGIPSDNVPHEDEQEADTPAEAEAMRNRRLAAEHGERILQLVAVAKENVRVTALDGGGFLAALEAEVPDLDVIGETRIAELRETGETEDGARAAVLKLYMESLPKFEAPQPSWNDVLAASEEQSAAEEIAALAGEQDVDAAFDAEHSLNAADNAPEINPADASEPASAPGLTAPPKTGLKAPRKKRGPRVVDATGPEEKEVTEETLAEAGAPGGGNGAPADLCFEDCSESHEHSIERTAF